jgi:hypothetical protein
MKSDPILQEVWDIKDRLAAEAGYDIKRFFEQLEAWSKAHPHGDRVVRDAEELRHLIQAKERDQKERTDLALEENPPPYDLDSGTKP